MPFFRKASRNSADKAKKQKDASSKKKRGGFLRKKKKPLIHSEDASRASSTQPAPRWNKIETDFTGLQPTTKGNVINESKKTPGIIVDGTLKQKETADKKWDAFDENGQLLLHDNQENRGFPKMQAIQEDDEVGIPKQESAFVEHTRTENESLGPVDMDEFVEENMLDQLSFPDPPENISDQLSFPADPPENISDQLSFPADPPENISDQLSFPADPPENISDQLSFPADLQQEHVRRYSNDINSFGMKETTSDIEDSTSPHEKSIPDDFTCELTYSHSVSSEGDTEEPVLEDTKPGMRMDDQLRILEEEEQVDDKSQDEPEEEEEQVDDKSQDEPEEEEEQVDDKSHDEPEERDDSNPSVTAYVSLSRIPKSDLSYASTAPSVKPSRSEESSQRSEWKPKPNMANPLGSTPQEIDALNRFLSVVGPNFNGRKLSAEDRKEIYDGARKVGLNKVLVDKFLDQSAGILTVEEGSTFSDLSCSSYSTTSRSNVMSNSDFSDQTSASGFSGDSEYSGDSMRYNYLPRTTSESPHAAQNYGCKGIFGDFFWKDPKKSRKDIFTAGQGILESIGAVMAGEDGSCHGEA